VLNHSADNKSWAPGTKPSDYHPFTNADRYNYAPVNYLQQPAVRNNLYAAGRFDITDNVSAYARVSYTQRQSSQQLAQVPTSLATSGGFGPQWAFGATADNVFNPFGGPVTTIGFRNVAVGPRHNNDDFNTLGSTAGLQGTFSFADRNFDWDVYGQYNSSRHTKIGLGYINLFNLKKGLGPSFADAAGLHCGTYDPDPNNATHGAIAGCTPFDIFSGPSMGLGNSYVRADSPDPLHPLKYKVTAADVQAMVDYVRYTEVAASGDKGINYGANISGEIAPLQGGMLSFAAGVEQRRERFFAQTDALVSSGGSSDNFVQPTKGETKVTEEYLELDAPLLKDLPGAKELELDAAVRKSKNTANGLIGSTAFATDQGSPTTKKFSVRWKPIDDLLIRASYGDTFRAPQVGDLFAGGSENFPAVADPCNATNIAGIPAAGQALCHAQGVPANGYTQQNTQVRALSGGNPFLQPEHGHNFTYGFVFSPSFISGLNLTADFWRIDLSDAIFAAGAQDFLDNCYRKGDPNACAFVTRLPNGQIANAQTGSLNLARLRTDGIDYGLTYKRDTGWGNFGVKWDITNLLDERTALGAGSPVSDVVGEYQGPSGAPNWKWRSVTTFDWTRGDWDASWTVRYTSKQDESCSRYGTLLCNHPSDISSIDDVSNNGTTVGFNRIGATTYHDVQIGWKAPWKAHVSLGARNVIGKEPPLTVNSFANSFDASYDLPGGPFYYFQYRQDF
jgi:outer membrane receptor protein involved in Fe transport